VKLDDHDLQAVAALLEEVLELPESEWEDWFARQSAIPTHQLSALKDMLAAEARGACNLPLLPQYSDVELSTLTQMAQDLPVGTLIGPYRLLREIGRGGMGLVWLAERSDGALKRQVALKLPHNSLPHRQLAERFGRERDILAGLVHPNIARLYDAGFTDQGQPYLALEYVEGQPLLDYCRERNLDLPARLDLFLQVLRAIQYAHSQLVVHRDLKPSNILVTHAGEVRLLDFGIAKLLTDGEAGEAELTQFDGRALTPQYAAPEQLLGQSIGTAADIYGLGILLYELLTGALPYRLKRDTRAALEDAILTADPAPPSQTAKDDPVAVGWAGVLRGDLDTIVLKALKKNPAERYITAAAFADDIVRFLKGEPVEAQPDSAWYRSRKFLLRHRLGVAMTALVIVALATGLGVALWQAEVARKEARTATAVKEFMQSIFLANTAQQDDPKKAREMTARELLDIGAAKVDEGLADAPEAKAEMLMMFLKLYSQLGLSGKAADIGHRWIVAARESHGKDSLEEVEALLMTALVLRYQTIADPAQGPLFDEAEAILARRGNRDAYHRGQLLAVSSSYWQEYDFPRAQADAKMALALLRNTEELDVALLRGATISLISGDYVQARDLAAESIASTLAFNASAKIGDGHHMLLPTLYRIRSEAKWALGNFAEAEEDLRQALTLARSTFGDRDFMTITIGGRLAEFLFATDRGKDEASHLLVEFGRTMASKVSSEGLDSPYDALESLGRAQYAARQYSLALESLTAALALRPGVVASPGVAQLLRYQVRVLLALHRFADAAAVLDRAVAMRIKSGLQNPAVEREEAELRSLLSSRNQLRPNSP
jgi:eukaryotic-like serine/threonine-protein kinase